MTHRILELLPRAIQEAAKAKAKFPQPNYTTLRIAEESSEVIRGIVHFAEGRKAWEEVEKEVVQLLALLIRFFDEGDEVTGVIPPTASKGAGQPDCEYSYYKQSGKWYTSGEGYYPTGPVTRESIIERNGGLPGLASKAEDFMIIVNPKPWCQVEGAHPALLKAYE